MTAEVYGHLLDGDLKISDQQAFDNGSKANDINKEQMFNAFMNAFQSMQAQNSNAVKLVSGFETRETQVQGSKGTLAPQVLRDYNESKAVEEFEMVENLKSVNETNALSAKEDGVPGRGRLSARRGSALFGYSCTQLRFGADALLEHLAHEASA